MWRAKFAFFLFYQCDYFRQRSLRVIEHVINESVSSIQGILRSECPINERTQYIVAHIFFYNFYNIGNFKEFVKGCCFYRTTVMYYCGFLDASDNGVT